MFRARLCAEGVPAFIAHEYHIGNAWHYSVCLGGVKVQVPDDRKDEALSVEKLCRDGEFKSLPAAISPLRGYMPKMRAGVVEVISTKRLSEIFPAFTPW